MPPDALSGQEGALGGPAQQDAAVTPQMLQNEHRLSLMGDHAERVQGLRQSAQAHKQKMVHNQQKHLLDLMLKEKKTAFDMQQANKRPYPAGA